MIYKCVDCGKEVNIELKSAKKIICPSCGYRILKKVRPNKSTKVMVR